MTQEKRKKPTPEEDREAFLDALSPPARRCMRSMCATPEAGVKWYNQLADVRAAIKVGVEVMEQSAREKAQAAGHPTTESNFVMEAARYALGAVTAVECAMSGIEKMLPSNLVVKEKRSSGPAHDGAPPGDGQNGTGPERLRRIDTD